MKPGPHVIAQTYEGEFSVNCECPGVEFCPHAEHYTDPPEPDSECVWLGTGSACTSARAALAALEALRDRISAMLSESG